MLLDGALYRRRAPRGPCGRSRLHLRAGPVTFEMPVHKRCPFRPRVEVRRFVTEGSGNRLGHLSATMHLPFLCGKQVHDAHYTFDGMPTRHNCHLLAEQCRTGCKRSLSAL